MWAFSAKSEEDWAEFDEAVDDLKWVINQTIDAYKAITPPTPPAPTESSEVSEPPEGPNWMARTGGKRKAKPSRKILEGGGI
jgi:hypothetical protein